MEEGLSDNARCLTLEREPAKSSATNRAALATEWWNPWKREPHFSQR